MIIPLYWDRAADRSAFRRQVARDVQPPSGARRLVDLCGRRQRPAPDKIADQPQVPQPSHMLRPSVQPLHDRNGGHAATVPGWRESMPARPAGSSQRRRRMPAPRGAPRCPSGRGNGCCSRTGPTHLPPRSLPAAAVLAGDRGDTPRILDGSLCHRSGSGRSGVGRTPHMRRSSRRTPDSHRPDAAQARCSVPCL